MMNNFEDSDNYYIMLEYCEGGSLFDYIKSKEKLTESEAKYLSF
jgi:serine/threonine protein kinase